MKKIFLIILAFLITSCVDYNTRQQRREYYQQQRIEKEKQKKEEKEKREEQKKKEKEKKEEEKKKKEEYDKNWQGFHVIVVDSCEYIEKIRVYHRDMDNRRIVAYAELAHKGNCRFCEERRKKREEENERRRSKENERVSIFSDP